MEIKRPTITCTVFEGLVMDEQLTYQLLKIMKHNGNVWELISGGYEFGQVAFFLDTLKQKHDIALDETGKTLITPDGEAFLSRFEENNHIKRYSKWVLPRSEMWSKPAGHRLFTSQKGDTCCSGMIAFTLSGVGAKMSSRHE